MKGQLIAFVFIILAVAGVITGYVFYNIFYGSQHQTQTFKVHTIDAVRNLIESFKNYLHLSLTYSSNQALREHAQSGALMPAGDWICNGPNPVEVEDSRECLEKHTTYYLNVYSDLFNTSLPVNFNKDYFSGCEYGVDESGVLDGEYDEGYFWSNCSGSKVSVSDKNINEYEEITTNDYITKNRYWYMFRIYDEWARADVYSKCVCGCCVGCAGCDCTLDCARRAYEDLVSRFDDDVICYEPEDWECCDHEYGPISCQPRSECLDWEDTDCKCAGHDCTEPPPLETASFSSNSKLENNLWYVIRKNGEDTLSNSSIYLQNLNCNCDYWVENRLAATYLFTCQDHKYYVPSDEGPVPLTFNALATAKWRCPDTCHNTATCTCPGGAETCDECECPPCPQNLCYG